jgi:O-acetylhomoserine (thiol)-lyase
VTLPRLGLPLRLSIRLVSNFAKQQRKYEGLFLQSLGNPKLDVLDLKSIRRKPRESSLVIDNTVASPYLLNPIEHGATIVIHSLTKYIAGNGTSLGGVIIDGGNFDWSSGKFPEFTEPSAGYHGLVYHEAGNAAFIAKVRIEGLRDYGAACPFNAFQIIQVRNITHSCRNTVKMD